MLPSRWILSTNRKETSYANISRNYLVRFTTNISRNNWYFIEQGWLVLTKAFWFCLSVLWQGRLWWISPNLIYGFNFGVVRVWINLEVFEEQLSLFCFHKTQMTSTRKITRGPYSGVLKSPVKNSFMAN